MEPLMMPTFCGAYVMAIDVDRFHANHDVTLFVVLSLLGEAKNT
jgi:hypothetical protein